MNSNNNNNSNIYKVIKVEMFINFITNGLLNGFCAWLIYHNVKYVPIDFLNIIIDTTITCFCISFLTCFFCSKASKRYLKKGIFQKRQSSHFLSYFPIHPLLLGASIGVIGTPLPILLFEVSFSMFDTSFLLVNQFILFKATWGAILVGTITDKDHLVYPVISKDISLVDSAGAPLKDTGGTFTFSDALNVAGNGLMAVVHNSNNGEHFDTNVTTFNGNSFNIDVDTNDTSPFMVYAAIEVKEPPVKTLALNNDVNTSPSVDTDVNSSVNTSLAVKTGDNSQTVLWLGLACMSGGLAVCFANKKRKHRSN